MFKDKAVNILVSKFVEGHELDVDNDDDYERASEEEMLQIHDGDKFTVIGVLRTHCNKPPVVNCTPKVGHPTEQGTVFEALLQKFGGDKLITGFEGQPYENVR